MTNNNNHFEIDIGSIIQNKEALISDDMRTFVSDQIGRENLLKVSDEWWIDFLLGVLIFGVKAKTIRAIE